MFFNLVIYGTEGENGCLEVLIQCHSGVIPP